MELTEITLFEQGRVFLNGARADQKMLSMFHRNAFKMLSNVQCFQNVPYENGVICARLDQLRRFTITAARLHGSTYNSTYTPSRAKALRSAHIYMGNWKHHRNENGSGCK